MTISNISFWESDFIDLALCASVFESVEWNSMTENLSQLQPRVSTAAWKELTESVMLSKRLFKTVYNLGFIKCLLPLSVLIVESKFPTAYQVTVVILLGLRQNW